MIIALFGCSGKTGLLLLMQALVAGHQIRCLVRPQSQGKFQNAIQPFLEDNPTYSENVNVLLGNIDGQNIRRTMFDGENYVDAVVATLCDISGTTCSSAQELIDNVILESHSVEGRKGVSKMITVTGYGVRESYEFAPYLVRLLINTFLRGLRDKALQEEMIEETVEQTNGKCTFTHVRPPELSNAPLSSNMHIRKSSDDKGKNLSKFRLIGAVPRRNIAEFIIGVCSEKYPQFENVAVSITPK